MKNRNEKMKVSVLTVAVQAALASMFVMPLCAQAADDTMDTTTPTNSVEIGVGNVSEKSVKFGEYNGLNDSGATGVLNFDIKGGAGYGSTSDATRWSINGSDLGTTSRALNGSVSQQGRWNFNLGYDELRHNISDTYRTPQEGSMGGNSFTVPATFGAVRGDRAPNVQPLPEYQNQLDAMHVEEVSTTRKNTSFGAGYQFNRQLSLQFDFNRLDQSGAKLLGTGANGGVAMPAGFTGNWRAEGNNIVMNPTNYQTDTFNLALNWMGDKGHLSAAYYMSLFKDGYDSLSFVNMVSDPTNNTSVGDAQDCSFGGACSYQRTVMSTAPTNSLHQFNLTGGYAIAPTTKLTGGFSYGRNTQNNSYLAGQPEIMVAPRASLDGLVVTTHADLKLTHQASKDLTLSAGLKYNERDNQSPSDLYTYHAINSVAATNLGYAAFNAPYSNRRTQADVAADYKMGKGRLLRVSLEHDAITRWCGSYRTDTTANCLVNPGNTEDTLGLTYRAKASDSVGFNVGYNYGKRSADEDFNAVTPLAGGTTAAGIAMDVNAQNYPGYVAYPYAARTRQLLKAGVNWSANDKLDFGLSGRYVDDNYDAVLGVQDGKTVGINLDATYAYSDKSSVSFYVSRQNSDRNLRAGAAPIAGSGAVGANIGSSYAALIAPTNIWTNQLEEDSSSIGISTKHTGLMGGKLELIGDLSYGLDTSKYATQVPNYFNATGLLCSSPSVGQCGTTPDIKTEFFTLKFTGNYQLNKNAKLGLGYMYQKLNSSDYYYSGLQNYTTPNRVLPTNEQAPNYSVSAVWVSYIYSFK